MDHVNNTFAEAFNYITPFRYVSGRIIEYDIASANINMLYKYGKINKEYYDYLNSLPKLNREIEIGLLIKGNSEYYETIKNGIINAKKELFNRNEINQASVVRIANDAVYINSFTDLKFTQFDNIIFKQKSIWTSMIKLDYLVLFFNFNSVEINVDIIGMKESCQELHSDYMLSIIANCVYLLERSSVKDALEFLEDFYNDYINLKLDKNFYRQFNSLSLFSYKNSDFLLSDVSNVSVEEIDINYNLYILRELWSIVLEKYSVEIRRQ